MKRSEQILNKYANYYMCTQQRIRKICLLWDTENKNEMFFYYKKKYQKNIRWLQYLEREWLRKKRMRRSK